MIKVMMTLTILLSLTGCQVASEVYRAGTGGAAFSCDQIRATFAAYEADRQSAQAAAALSSMVSAGTGNIGNQVVTSSDSYFNQAREKANIALLIQGCPPL